MSLRRTRGLTLAETIVAIVLALLLGILMLKLLISGLGAHSKGAESRDAQAGVRNLVSLLVAELRSSSVPPLAEPLVISPVFLPGVWGGDQEPAGVSEFYPRAQVGDASTPEGTDEVTNRVVYVRTKENLGASDQGPLDPFVLVELFVPQERPWLVERRFHKLDGLDSLMKKERVQGADGQEREAWVLDLPALEALETEGPSDILFDAGPEARVAFRVSHAVFQPVSDPGRTRYPELFEPGVFRLAVAVAIRPKSESATQKPWPDVKDWSTMREESTEIRIPVVRQS